MEVIWTTLAPNLHLRKDIPQVVPLHAQGIVSFRGASALASMGGDGKIEGLGLAV